MSPFDPTAPLPPAPKPWASTDVPSPRSGPPWHMTDMIAAEPHVARRLLEALAPDDSPAARLAGAIGQAATAGEAIVVTGCGTSEHAALGVVEILRQAMRVAGLPHGPTAIVGAQAFELAQDPPSAGLVVGISHEGGTWATNLALAASRDAGVRTAIVTASGHSPGAALAGIVVETVELDQGWCHVIGYGAPLVAGAAIGAHLAGQSIDPGVVEGLLAAGAADEAGAEAIAARLADAKTLIVVGSGADRVAARELVLKVEEGTWLPSAMRDLETFLHGHLPAMDDTTGLVLVLADRNARAERLARALQLLASARVLDMRTTAILARDVDAAIPAELTPAGRLIVEEAPALPAPVAALLGTATPLQLLAERLARARGTNPDPIRRDAPLYREASAAAE